MPGIGYFTSRKTEANIDHQNQLIYPSGLTLTLTSDQVQRADEMIMNIHRETGFETQILEAQLADLCGILTRELKEHSNAEFEPYGLLKINDTGEVKFSPSDFNLHKDFLGLGPVTLTPLMMIYQKSEEPIVPIKPMVKKKEPNLKWLYYLLAILWILFLILLLWPSGPQKSNPIVQSPMIEDPAVKSFDSNDNSEIFSSDTIVADTLSFEKEVEIVEDNINQVNEEVMGKTCVIIVGSFLKKSNAIRMQEKVSEDGYQVYTELYGDFNRVGIQFDCFHQKLEEVLEELKQKYHPDSWILKH